MAICLPFGEKNKTYLAPFYVDGTRIFGTGLILDDTGDILTAAHVADHLGQELQYLHKSGVKATLSIGINPEGADPIGALSRSITYIPASLWKQTNQLDVAILRLGLPGLPTKALHERAPIMFTANPPQEGDEVLTAGFPGNSFSLIATLGAIASSTIDVPQFSRAHGSTRQIEMYQIDIHGGAGDSGAPVLSMKDRAIIGMLIESNGNSIANVIPSSEIVGFLERNNIHWRPDSAARRPKRVAGKT